MSLPTPRANNQPTTHHAGRHAEHAWQEAAVETGDALLPHDDDHGLEDAPVLGGPGGRRLFLHLQPRLDAVGVCSVGLGVWVWGHVSVVS